MSETLLRELERLGVARGILVDIARREQILEVRCEMPHCYHHKGRKAFDPRSQRPPSNWELTADHYPRLKMHGGRLTLDNVRLAHRLCNRVDYGWRIKIGPPAPRKSEVDACAGEEGLRLLAAIHTKADVVGELLACDVAVGADACPPSRGWTSHASTS